ncbi:MAG: hypothetical protein Q8R40_04485 [bacterium]|nr:hypothetical protein [bacterium]
MRRIYFFAVGFVLVIVGITMIVGKLYPVAMVNGSLVWYRTWRTLERATQHALIVELTASKTKLPADNKIALIIKQDTLKALVENRILVRLGKKEFVDFELRSQDRVNRLVPDKNKMEKAAMFMYGLDAQAFNDLILMPQSRREVAQEDLDKRHVSFEDWFIQTKKEAHVRMLFTSFIWDGVEVVASSR